MSCSVTLSYKSLRIRRLYNNRSIIFKATIVHSFFEKKKTFYVESMKMLSRNCTVCPLLRGGSRHTACCAGWWMRHCYILSVQSMDFTKWLLSFSSCLQDAGINEAPRPSSQYLLPTVVAVGTQIFPLLFLILWNGVMFRFYSHLTFIHIDALGFLSPSVSDLTHSYDVPLHLRRLPSSAAPSSIPT